MDDENFNFSMYCKYSGSSFSKTHFGSKRVVSINDVLLTA